MPWFRALAPIAALTLSLASPLRAQESPPPEGEPPAQIPPDQVIPQVVNEDPTGLVGLTRIDVALGETVLAGGVSTRGLEARLEDAVTRAGLEVNAGIDVPVLELQTHLSETDDPLIFGRMTLALRQPCTLVRNSQTRVTATTWTRTSVMLSSANADTLRTLMETTTDTLINQFLTDYAQANPTPPAQTQRSWWVRWIPFI